MIFVVSFIQANLERNCNKSECVILEVHSKLMRSFKKHLLQSCATHGFQVMLADTKAGASLPLHYCTADFPLLSF